MKGFGELYIRSATIFQLGTSGSFDIYIIYTPSLGLPITLPGREREQGRFRGSSEGARGSIEGARGSTVGARGSAEGAEREHYRAVQGRSGWEA